MLATLPNVKDFNPTVVIYHANCSDGFGAAYIARHYSQLNALPNNSGKIRLIPYSHKDKIADFLENQNIVFIDCCYERNDLLHVKEVANKVLVLDHHDTVDRGCGDLDFVHLDRTRSGVRLAWNFFFFEQIIPVQFLHIEDRDLFRFSLDYTKFFCAALDSYEMSFDVWDQYFSIDMSESHYAMHIQIGRSIIRYKETIIRQLTKNSHKIDFFGYLAVWCNVPFPLHSDAGNFLKETLPDCKFSICIGIEDLDIIYLSFRSLNFNVLEIVESLGGGGHPNAAGCRITREKFNELFNVQHENTVSKYGFPRST